MIMDFCFVYLKLKKFNDDVVGQSCQICPLFALMNPDKKAFFRARILPCIILWQKVNFQKGKSIFKVMTGN
jgi:hypothetical protein